MRLFILPSWCPTADAPFSGAFFVEQAHAIARARPDWTIGICQFDLSRSRFPWRPWHWAGFADDWRSQLPVQVEAASSGLLLFRTWHPYLPRFGAQSKWKAAVCGLADQARIALQSFTERVGKPDLIHAHAIYPGGAAAVAVGRELGIPVGITEHLGPFPPPTLCLSDGRVMPLISDAYAGATAHSAVSRALADRLITLGLSERVEVLPNFLVDDFGIDVGEGLDAPRADDFCFLSVGGPSRGKGTDVLLTALARIEAPVTLRIAGAGPELQVFQRMASELGLADRVVWLGALDRSQLLNEYRRCDGFVLPSRAETFGIVFIEALACGKPIVATACGGPQDIVRPENGMLVPVDDVLALAVAMETIANNSQSFAPETLRQDFLARFSVTSAIGNIEQWYEAVLARKSMLASG